MKKIINFVFKNCRVLLFGIIFTGSGALFAAKEEPLVNRRVLVLDFINVTNSADYSYLEGSIPESLLDPLSKTKSFEILLRTTWAKYVTEQKFNKEDAYKEEIAIEAGKLAGADVVVIGQFIAQTDHIQIQAKAIEMSSGRIMVSQSTAAPLDNDMFNAIDNMTKQMANEMKNKLPPLAQKIIIEQRIKYVDSSAKSPRAMIRQAQTETKAQRWRDMERVQAERWRMMEADQASKWRLHESATIGWKEREAIIANTYWSQPLFLRLLGNITIGTFTGGIMGFGSSLGFSELGSNFSFSNHNLLVVAVSGGTSVALGLATGIIVTILDNNHLNEYILGPKLLVSSTLWWTLGAVIGSGVGIAIGYIAYETLDMHSLLVGASAGSVLGLATGITLALLPQLNIIPKDTVKNLVLDFNPLNSKIGYGIRF
jgi:TolB-like protein